MIVGVPKETKTHEYRVSMTAVGVDELVRRGHRVLVESDAGSGSGISNDEYAAVGAEIAATAKEIFAQADMIVKVKEPLAPERAMMREGQVMFTYFHFAADRELTEGVLKTGAVAVAYETIFDSHGRLPLLTPMSEVAGKMSIQEGAKYLERPMRGRGMLRGGVPGVEPAEVLIIGGGIVDVGVDQGGWCETIHATTHDAPTYIVENIVHYGVTNMPGAVGRTSTFSLTNATLPYALKLAALGYRRACNENPGLAAGINIERGTVTNKPGG